MRGIAGTIAALLVGMAMPGVARAQSTGRLSAAGTIEYARITDDESLLGAGIGGAGGVAWRLTDATALEIEAGRTRHVRDFHRVAVAVDGQGGFQQVPLVQRWEGAGTFVIASVAHAFGSGRARPVLWGGGGVMSHGGTRRGPVALPQVPPGFALQPLDTETIEGESSRALVADGGAGLEVRLAPRVSVRPFVGVRFANTGNVGPKYVIRTGVRVGFR